MPESYPNSAGIAPSGALSRLDQWIARREALLFAALMAVHIVPLWWFQYFPSLDGPAHLSIADVLVRYHGAEVPAFREFYEINTRLEPNYFIFAVLYVLMQVFPPLTAEKLLLSGYVVLLPLALRYAVRAAAPEASALSFIAFPLVYHYPLHLGFYNFSFGMAFFLFAFGFWLKHSDKTSLAVFLGHLLLSLAAYACHLFTVAISGTAIAFTTIGLTALELGHQLKSRAFDAGLLWRRFQSRALLPAAAYLPAIALGLAYLLRQEGDQTASGLVAVDWPDTERLRQLLVAASLVAHDASELVVSKAFVISLLALAGLVVARKTPGASRIDGLFFCLIGFLGLYLFTPYQFHVRWMPDRLMPYVFFSVVLWFASQLPTATARRAVLVRPFAVIALAAVSLLGLSLRAPVYAKLNEDIREYLSGMEHIEPNATLLSLRLDVFAGDELISDRIDLFLQAAGYIAMKRSVIDLTNLQAATGVFPIVYRRAVDPYRHLATDAELTALPPRVDLFRYAERTGKDIDYVLLWGGEQFVRDSADGHRLMAQLAAAYELVFTSPRRGLMRLYRLKESARAARASACPFPLPPGKGMIRSPPWAAGNARPADLCRQGWAAAMAMEPLREQ